MTVSNTILANATLVSKGDKMCVSGPYRLPKTTFPYATDIIHPLYPKLHLLISHLLGTCTAERVGHSPPHPLL